MHSCLFPPCNSWRKNHRNSTAKFSYKFWSWSQVYQCDFTLHSDWFVDGSGGSSHTPGLPNFLTQNFIFFACKAVAFLTA